MKKISSKFLLPRVLMERTQGTLTQCGSVHRLMFFYRDSPWSH